MSAPTDILPAPDGGIVVVGEDMPPIFTWITRRGALRSYITTRYPLYSDGSSPGGAISAYQDSPTSAIVTTDQGEITRIYGNHATLLGRLPDKNNSEIISSNGNHLFIGQGNNLYDAPISHIPIQPKKLALKGLKNNYYVGAVFGEKTRYFATNGNIVMALSASGRTVWKSKIEKGDTITALTSDERGGTWVGDTKGGLFHVLPNGKLITISDVGKIARGCSTEGESPPIGGIYSMLLRGNQLYIVDKSCDRIVVFGAS